MGQRSASGLFYHAQSQYRRCDRRRPHHPPLYSLRPNLGWRIAACCQPLCLPSHPTQNTATRSRSHRPRQRSLPLAREPTSQNNHRCLGQQRQDTKARSSRAALISRSETLLSRHNPTQTASSPALPEPRYPAYSLYPPAANVTIKITDNNKPGLNSKININRS